MPEVGFFLEQVVFVLPDERVCVGIFYYHYCLWLVTESFVTEFFGRPGRRNILAVSYGPAYIGGGGGFTNLFQKQVYRVANLSCHPKGKIFHVSEI